MGVDSLKVNKNDDGTFAIEWDRNDPNWSWLNGLTEEQIQIIMKQAITDYLDDLKSPEF